ncbi:hypothetical protein P7K49_027470, partial [Saguinus oedipus]
DKESKVQGRGASEQKGQKAVALATGFSQDKDQVLKAILIGLQITVNHLGEEIQ